MTKLHGLNKLEQSVWFDFIRRSYTNSGDLQKLLDLGIRGVTSNPSIFEKAIAGSSDYDDDLRSLVGRGKSVTEIYEALAFADIQAAADLLRPIYDQEAITQQLQDDGVAAFASSFEALLTSIEEKREKLVGALVRAWRIGPCCRWRSWSLRLLYPFYHRGGFDPGRGFLLIRNINSDVGG